jgi:hypothetical protein
MRFQHQSRSSIQPLAGVARQLHLAGVLVLQARAAGWLQVTCGPVWVTRSGDPQDHVLADGEHLLLAAGEQVLAEPWRAGCTARLAWQTDPPASASAKPAMGQWGLVRAGRRLVGGLRAWAAGLAWAARSAAAKAIRAQGSMAAGDSIASSGARQ